MNNNRKLNEQELKTFWNCLEKHRYWISKLGAEYPNVYASVALEYMTEFEEYIQLDLDEKFERFTDERILGIAEQEISAMFDILYVYLEEKENPAAEQIFMYEFKKFMEYVGELYKRCLKMNINSKGNEELLDTYSKVFYFIDVLKNNNDIATFKLVAEYFLMYFDVKVTEEELINSYYKIVKYNNQELEKTKQDYIKALEDIKSKTYKAIKNDKTEINVNEHFIELAIMFAVFSKANEN